MQTGTRSNGDRRARTTGQHSRQDHLQVLEGSENVGRKVTFDKLDRRVEKSVHVAGTHVAAIVDERVDSAPQLEHHGGGGPHRGEVEEIRGRASEERPAASIAVAVVVWERRVSGSSNPLAADGSPTTQLPGAES